MPSSSEIVSQMRSALRLTEPDLDTTIGSPVRKILDAVGEVVAEASADAYLLQYQYDLETKSDADLDEFVRLFGFARFPARRATGTITFERISASDNTVVIRPGTQFATEGANAVVVATIVPAIIPIGSTTTEVPVQAIIPGVNGNVAANSLRRRLSPLTGITSFANTGPLTGGADAESDDQLRLRFRRTVFRNLAGTEQMFLATALEDPAVTQANVVGATKRFREQIQLVAGAATSTVQDAKLVYPETTVFGPNIDAAGILRQGVHYTIDAATPPTVTRISAATVPDGVYDLEIEYVSTASRNDPQNGVTNRVDIYLNGERLVAATESTMFRTSKVFSDTSGDALYRHNFRKLDGTPPLAGEAFVPLSFVPIATLPSTVTIAGVTYHLDPAQSNRYSLVHDYSVNGLTPDSLAGLVFPVGMTNPIADEAIFTVAYTYNSVPRDVQEAVRAWRLITTDVRVHQAKEVLLRLHLAVMYEPGYDETTVANPLYQALARHISGVSFNQSIQVSDILSVAHLVTGVDAVRLTNASDGADYGIQFMAVDSSGNDLPGAMHGNPRSFDLPLGDDELAALHSIVLTTKAQNTFGAV